MSYSDYDKRMKKYEYVSRNYLTTRVPVIIRIDGKAFHTFTNGFQCPFDSVLSKSMQDTMLYLCENIQGCVLGYTQSDEITLILTDYKDINTSPWFDYNVQKCVSVSASMATMAFNRAFAINMGNWWHEVSTEWRESGLTKMPDYLEKPLKLYGRYQKALERGAMFDARVFNIPKDEVTNNIYWRQQDAIRNSVQMVGRAYFSNKELHKKSISDIIRMLINVKSVDWNDYPMQFRRGSCCVRKPVEASTENTVRNPWVIDNDIPVFKAEGRKYVDELIYIGESKESDT